jgi:hypothetical protein
MQQLAGFGQLQQHHHHQDATVVPPAAHTPGFAGQPGLGPQTLVPITGHQVSLQLGYAGQSASGLHGQVPFPPEHTASWPAPFAGGSNEGSTAGQSGLGLPTLSLVPALAQQASLPASRQASETGGSNEGDTAGPEKKRKPRYFKPLTKQHKVDAGRMLLQLSQARAKCTSYQSSTFGTLPVWDAPSTEAPAFGETR